LILWSYIDNTVYFTEDAIGPMQHSKRSMLSNLNSTLQLMGSIRHFGYDLTPLAPSDRAVLGMQCPPKLRDLHAQQTALSFFGAGLKSRGKRNYFLLLVAPTGSPDTYRRVGIGAAFWLPTAQRFGGVELPAVAKSKRVILL